MVRSAVCIYAMDIETSDASRVRAYRGEHNVRADFTLPQTRENTKHVGCGVKNWKGKPMRMVCFHTGKPLAPNEKSDLFLFVVDRGALADSPEQNQLLMARFNTLSTVTWAEGERVYLLASPDETVLRETLSVKSL